MPKNSNNPNYIQNPKTGRYVKKTGRIGKLLIPCPNGKIRNPASKRCVKEDSRVGRYVQSGRTPPKRKKRTPGYSSKSLEKELEEYKPRRQERLRKIPGKNEDIELSKEEKEELKKIRDMHPNLLNEYFEDLGLSKSEIKEVKADLKEIKVPESKERKRKVDTKKGEEKGALPKSPSFIPNYVKKIVLSVDPETPSKIYKKLVRQITDSYDEFLFYDDIINWIRFRLIQWGYLSDKVSVKQLKKAIIKKKKVSASVKKHLGKDPSKVFEEFLELEY